MKARANLLKMSTELKEVAHYYLNLGSEQIHMNDLIGKKISLSYLGQINCIKCGRETKTSFAQGYCYPCFISAPETEECVLRPELCMAHKGEARDMEFAKNHCLIDHFVYLAISSGLKVGVTRHTQIPTRWIDQGASKAIKIAKTPNRHIAGTLEVALKLHLNDKTNWRNMLMNKVAGDIDLSEEKIRAISHLHPDFRVLEEKDNEITEIKYPVMEYPAKVKSLNFEKTPIIHERLTGIKGQYLIFENGHVFNIRKHNGYLVEMEF